MPRIFKRKIYERLLKWKSKNGKTAILIEGARRIGKTTLVEQFASNEYESHLIIDFNKASKQVKDLFNDIMKNTERMVYSPFLISFSSTFKTYIRLN